MTEAELNKLLCKIGKSVFVRYFHEFSNPNLSNQDVIALLPQEYTFESRTTRTSKSRRILREGMAEEALALIASSDHVEPEASMQARALLTQIRSRT
jgi:hypothetical protein